MNKPTADMAAKLLAAHRAANVAYDASAEQINSRQAWQDYYTATDATDAIRTKLQRAEDALAKAQAQCDKAYAALHASEDAARAVYQTALAAERAAEDSPSRAALEMIRETLRHATGEQDIYDAQSVLAQIIKSAAQNESAA